MTDIRRAVDEIRFYLDSNEAEMTDSIREAAREFSEACRQANQRLRRCGDFLNRNLRSEAIQLAEADPDLLELVASLDFPGRSNWDQMVGLYNLPVSEPLLIDVAEALNEAYALQEPIKKLLDRHRFLALSRAQPKQRLAVLWKLVEQDGAVGAWESDACDMEQVRLREIEHKARDAAQRVDARELHALLDEIEQGKWIATVPDSLNKTIVQLTRDADITEARAKLRDVALALETTFAERNVMEARELKLEWDRLQPAAGLDGFEPIFLRVSPVLRWIAEEDAKEETRRKQERALVALRQGVVDPGIARDRLEHLGKAVLRFESTIPEPLGTQFRDRVARLKLGEKRRRIFLVSACASACIAAVAVVGLLLWRTVRIEKARQSAETVTQMVDRRQFGEARQFVQQHPDVYPSAEWNAALQTLVDAERREKVRLADYRAVMHAVGKVNEYAEARPNLEKARQLATTADEKSEVAQLETGWEVRHRDELLGKETDVRRRVDAIAADLNRGDGMVLERTLPAELDPLMIDIARKLSELPETAETPNAKLQPQIELLSTRLKALQTSAAKAKRKVTLLEAIKNQSLIRPTEGDSTKRLAGYVAMLGDFAKSFPDDPRAADFREVAKELSAYQGICQWQRLAHRWASLFPLNIDDARRRAAECDQFLKSWVSCPVRPTIDRYARFLAAILRREEGDEGDKAGGLKAKLHELFAGPLMRDVHLIRDKEGNAYYLGKEVDFTGLSTANIPYLCDFSGKIRNKTIDTAKLKSPVSVEAPQSRLAESANKELAGVTLTNWDERLKSVCRQVRETGNLDPFLQYALLRYTLEYASGGSDPLEAELKKPLETLHDADMDLSTRWMVPDDARSQSARANARQLLSRVGDLDAAWKRAEETRQHLAQELLTRCFFVGVLARHAGPSWECVTPWSPDGEYELVVLDPGADKTPPAWETIGRVKVGQLKLTDRETTSMREGRLVIARRVPAPSAASSGRGAAVSERVK